MYRKTGFGFITDYSWGSMKKISIVSSCFNEEENIEILYNAVKKQMEPYLDRYEYEQIIVDNCSTDNSAKILRELAEKDKNLKVILNARNFGHIRSPYWAMINGAGDAIIYMASDLQDPPELIGDFIKKWEEGYKIVLGQKRASEEFFLMRLIRNTFYYLIGKIADDGVKLVPNCTGFGLYDKQIIDIARTIDDPYPYFRGLICEIGFEQAIIPFVQPTRKHGKTKNNFYTLYDNAMIGIIKHSKLPLRLASFIGSILSLASLTVAVFYFIYKLIFWNSFSAGQAPLVIGLFFFSSVQLFFIGVLGEYIGAIYTRINKKPLVIEKERINF